jgi:uncharacterized protein (DUF433 family)
VSIRLREDQGERLRRFSRELGSTPSEAAARLVEEGLRRSEFALIDFRSTRAGRVAFVQGSRVAVWHILMIGRDYNMDVHKIAEHLEWPDFRVQAALNYYAAFPGEIEEALADNDSYDLEKLRRLLPNIETFIVENSVSTVAEAKSAGYQAKISKTGKSKQRSRGRK